MMHASPNQASAQGKPPALRAQVLALCAEVRYEGFGPTLMAEQLLQAKLVVDHEALRRWRLATSQHTVRRRKQNTGNGGNASRALGRWCNWTARTTTGSSGAAPSAC